MESKIAAPSKRKSKAERLFYKSVLPALQDMAELIANSGSLTISIFLDEERIIYERSRQAEVSCCQAGKESRDFVPLSCLPSADSFLEQLANPISLFVPRGVDPPKGKIIECAAGCSLYVNAVWIPKLGVLAVVACCREKISFKSSSVRLLRRLVSLALDLCYIAVEWHYLGETLIHELLLILLACTSSAERLQKLGTAGIHGLNDEKLSEMVFVARHIGDEAKMGVYEFDNALRYLSSGSSVLGDRSLGLAGIRKPREVSVDLEGELRESIERLIPRASEKSIELRNEVRLETRAIVYADPYEIRRAFYNVIGNAIKYSYHSISGKDSAAHAEQRYVRIFANDPDSSDGMTIALIFENYGLGLLAGEEKLISLPGYRGVLAEREARIGSGIGLSEVYKIMTSLGGKLSFQSSPRGTGPETEIPHLFRVKLVFPVSARGRV